MKPSKLHLASLHTKATSHLLALDILPVGAVVGDLVLDFLPHTAEQLKHTRKLGVPSRIAWETLRELKPDAILWGGADNPAVLKSLEEVAPVCRVPVQSGNWRDHLRFVSAFVGREAGAEAFIASYEEKAERVKGLLGQVYSPETTFAAVRVVGEELRLMGIRRPLGHLLYEDLGRRPVPAAADIHKPYEVIDPADLTPLVKADVILLMVFRNDASQKFYSRLSRSPEWNDLKAVRNGQVYSLQGQAWLDYSSWGHWMALEDAELLFGKA